MTDDHWQSMFEESFVETWNERTVPMQPKIRFRPHRNRKTVPPKKAGGFSCRINQRLREVGIFNSKLCESCSNQRPRQKVTVLPWNSKVNGTVSFVGLCDHCVTFIDRDAPVSDRELFLFRNREARKSARRIRQYSDFREMTQLELEAVRSTASPRLDAVIQPGHSGEQEIDPESVGLICECCGDASWSVVATDVGPHAANLCAECAAYSRSAFDGDVPTEREAFLEMLFEMQELEDCAAWNPVP